MAQPMLNKTESQAEKKEAVVIKKYANRRLYSTETSTYVTLEDLAQMVRGDKDFVVYDAKSGDDLTHAVLTQIIVEHESRPDGNNLLPTPFLRQLIRFYGDSLQGFMGSYLERSMQIFLEQQTQFRTQLNTLLGQSPWAVMTDLTERNLQLWQQLQQGFGKPPPPMPPGSSGLPPRTPDTPISNKPRGK